MSEKVYFNSVLVSMISIYKSSEVKPHIIQLFKNAGLVYTNRVPLKLYLQEHEGVRIFDKEDLS